MHSPAPSPVPPFPPVDAPPPWPAEPPQGDPPALPGEPPIQDPPPHFQSPATPTARNDGN